jgi:hypothetical protein
MAGSLSVAITAVLSAKVAVVDSSELAGQRCLGGIEVIRGHYLGVGSRSRGGGGEFCVFIFNLDKEVSAMEEGFYD